MPCWSYNKIVGFGSEKDIDEFVELTSMRLECNQFIPAPVGIREHDEYQWQVDNWGAKWGITSQKGTLISEGTGTDYICFEYITPWCPPEPVIRRIVERFCRLKFLSSAILEQEGYGGLILEHDSKLGYRVIWEIEGHGGEFNSDASVNDDFKTQVAKGTLDHTFLDAFKIVFPGSEAEEDPSFIDDYYVQRNNDRTNVYDLNDDIPF